MAKDSPTVTDEGVKTPKVSETKLSSQITARWSALDADASYWMQMWQVLSTYVMPRKSYILNQQYGPNLDRETQLYDTTAVRACQTQAAGIMSYVNDADSNWVALSAPEEIEDQEGVNEYYAECSKIILQELARSNFYAVAHEAYLDRSCFGTCAMFVDKTDDFNLLFRTFDVGTFRVSENNEGYVDTIFVKREMTVRQVVEEYGLSNVSEKTRKAYELGDGKGLEQKLDVIWAIYPRNEKERTKGKIDGPNKPIASVHIELGTKKLLRNSGFDEPPCFVSRFLKWQQSPYGWSSAWVALPDAKQLNFLQKQMDALAELAAFPRMLIPEGLSDEPDLRAGGITYFDETKPQAIPREWMTQGRYDIGQDRIKMKQQHIEDAFNVPLFQMFAQEDMQAGGQGAITATQVRAMESEKLTMLSPTYARLTTEFLIPIIKRVYGILSRAGMMPAPPQSLIQQNPKGEQYIPEPKVIFNNKMSIAVSSREVNSIDPIIEATLQVCQVTQDLSPMDNFDMDKIARQKALTSGVDPEFLRDAKAVAGIRQNRAQQQQQQAQMQQQAHQAQIAQQIGSVRPDSPAAPAIQQGMQQAMGQ